jgi:hypothetical protein
VRFGNLTFLAGLAVLVLAACGRPPSNVVPAILLFEGTGTSPNDVRAVKSILETRHLEFSTADSSRLNGMSASDLQAHRLLIVPGGNYITMGNGLAPHTTATIHDAVQRGLNYLGICAGGLLAGNVPGNGLNLAAGVRFGFYGAVNRGVHKAAVEITAAGVPPIEHYWEDGPQYTGWGAVVGKYPDGTPAIVQGRSGKGWVILVGTHPEAPEGWRRGMPFTAPAGAANAYAGILVESASNGTPLPHF